MDVDFLRRICRALPGTTEHVQWESLVFKVAGKIYAIAALEPRSTCLSFKVSPDDFADLTERPGIVQAPYTARGQWAALEHEDALTAAETKECVRRSYHLVRAKLPKKVQAKLASA